MLNITESTPYYAVIFTSKVELTEEYVDWANRIEELANKQKGFLGIEGARGEDEVGITISYWKTEQDILNWKENAEHKTAQKLGYEKFYKWFTVKVCKVERAYSSKK